jgi:hypothetical protein
MANILIDPVIVMSPSDNARKEDVEAWLVNLDLWLTEALSSPFTWLYAKEATEELLCNGLFPTPEILFRWQRKYRLNSNVALINAKLGKFFNSEESNNHLGFHLEQMGYLVLAIPESVVITPVQFVSRWPDVISNCMCELLVTTCACKHNSEPFAHKMRIATLILDDATREIAVSAVVKEALPDFIRPDDNKVSQVFPLIFTPDDLVPLFNIVECWDKGEIGVKYAIKHQYKKDWYNIAPNSLPYELNTTHFISSVMARKDMTDLMLYRIVRTMAGVIADKPELLQHKPHWLREREESHTPQLIRASDNATAWRITITHDGAGWRMHYWRKTDPDGNVTIEFSNVLTKKDPVVIY